MEYKSIQLKWTFTNKMLHMSRQKNRVSNRQKCACPKRNRPQRKTAATQRTNEYAALSVELDPPTILFASHCHRPRSQISHQTMMLAGFHSFRILTCNPRAVFCFVCRGQRYPLVPCVPYTALTYIALGPALPPNVHPGSPLPHTIIAQMHLLQWPSPHDFVSPVTKWCNSRWYNKPYCLTSARFRVQVAACCRSSSSGLACHV